MPPHLPGGIPQSLELRDLLTLQPHQPRQHCIHHERRHTQKHHGIRHRKRPHHAQLIIQPSCAVVLLPRVSPLRPILQQQPVHLRHHRLRLRPWRKIDAEVIESTVQIIRHGDGLVVHPEDPVAFVVRQRLPRPRLKHKLRRKPDAADDDRVAVAVDHRHQVVADLQLIRQRKGFTHHRLPSLVR